MINNILGRYYCLYDGARRPSLVYDLAVQGMYADFYFSIQYKQGFIGEIKEQEIDWPLSEEIYWFYEGRSIDVLCTYIDDNPHVFRKKQHPRYNMNNW